MASSQAEMTVRRAGERACVIDIRGEVSGTSENALMDSYARACEANPRAIILNFAGLEYMNSSGIGLLVTLLVRVRRQGQRLLAAGLSEHYRHIFQLTRLDEAIRVYDDEAQAIAAESAAA